VGLEGFVADYGADTARLFTLFAAPPEKDLEWRDEGAEGCWRFLQRVWRLVHEGAESVRRAPAAVPEADPGERWRKLRRAAHQTIRRVTHDLDGRFHLNTAVAAIMELTNALAGAGLPPAWGAATTTSCTPEPDPDPRAAAAVHREAVTSLLRLLSPFAPHLCDELWSRLGFEGTVLEAGWPSFDPAVAADETITYPIQVMGKLRGQIAVAPDAAQDDVVAAAKAEANVARHLAGRTIVKTVFVPGRLVNFVVQ
jgi:leucyl-tRNA synthetase